MTDEPKSPKDEAKELLGASTSMDVDSALGDVDIAQLRIDLALAETNDGVWDWDIAANTAVYTLRYLTTAGYEIDEFSGRLDDWMRFVHPDDFEQTNAAVKAYLRGETETYSSEFRFKRRDGDWMWIRSRGIVVERDDAGRPRRMIGIHIDITDQVKAERALKESEARLRNIVENSSNLFYSHTTDHRVTYVSPQIRDYLGYEPEEVMIRWTELASDHPMNHRGFEVTERAIATGERQPPYELELVDKQGEKIFVEVREAPVVEDGETVAIVGSLTDITERKRVEAELQVFKAVLETANYGSAIADLDGIVQYVNPCWANTHGYDVDELIGRHLSVFHTESQMRMVDETNLLLTESGSFRAKEIGHVHRDGSEFTTLMNGVVLHDEHGNPSRIAVSAIDISDLVAAREELKQHRDRLEDLVAERTQELAERMDDQKRMLSMMAGREIRMAELKEIIAKLKEQIEGLGHTPIVDRR